ncbi:MAG: AAA family ATPase [Thermoguttaceae bacterium]
MIQIDLVRLSNLNSLVGDWSIDFQDPEYLENGIFVIGGPTGSGKSTILDAICLALFGRTPRLAKCTQTENEIMSRGTGFCSAEIEFRTESGQYRATWSQSRARKATKGKLQTPEHEIGDARTGHILEDRLKNREECVKTLIGMDFDQFTRTVLLAQGDFDKFLRASANDRSPILERITGTEIYSDISIAVFERQKEEKNRLELLRAELSGVELFSETEEGELNRQRAELNVQIVQIQDQQHVIFSQIEFLEQLEELKKSVHDLSVQLEELTKQEKNFQPELARLTRFERFQKIFPAYKELRELRTQMEVNRETLAEKSRCLRELQLRHEVTTKERDLLKNSWTSVAAEQERERPHFIKARELDVKIAHFSADLRTVEEKLQQATKLYEATDKQIKGLQEQLERQQSVLEMQLPLIQTDSVLPSSTSPSSSSSASSVSSSLSSSSSASSPHFLEESTIDAMKQLTHTVEEDAYEKVQQQLQDLLNRELEQFNQEERLIQDRIVQINEERVFLATVQSLNQHRQELHLNEPCPLCGSLEHPFVTESFPDSAKNEKEWKRIQQRQKQMQSQKHEMETFFREYADHLRSINILQNKINAQTVLLLKSQAEMTDYFEEKTRRKSEMDQYKKERSSILDNRDPDVAERTLQQKIDLARKEYEEKRQQGEHDQLEQVRLNTEIGMIEERIQSDQQILLLEKEPSFARKRQDSGFSSEEDFLASELPDDLLQQLQNRATFFSTERSRINGLLSEKQKNLIEKQEQPIPEQPLEMLRELKLTLTTNLNTFNQKLGEINGRLLTNEQQRKRHLEKLGQIAVQERECRRFSLLNELVGSADGKKFRNFAQGLTFNHLLSHANQQLSLLSPRYRLTRANGPLECDVIDLDQNGEVRSTKNLSGGESFLTSLALALGLAQMVSNNVQTESLFLDEGFGTLDEETLECTISALATLRQSGKRIGIISHVNQLKERIPTQIRLIPLPSGRSRIEGPGVRKETTK